MTSQQQPGYGSNNPFWPDLIWVEEGELHTYLAGGGLQRIDHFPSIFIKRSYMFHLRSGMI